MIVRRLIHPALAASLLLAGPAALAQTGPDQPPPESGQRAMPRTLAERVEQQIAELHQRLGITPAEEPQWNAFAQVMRDNAAHMERAFRARAALGSGMNAVEDLRSFAAIADAHAEDMRRLVPAFEALYAAMTPAQQKTADEVFREFERRRGGREGPG